MPLQLCKLMIIKIIIIIIIIIITIMIMIMIVIVIVIVIVKLYFTRATSISDDSVVYIMALP